MSSIPTSLFGIIAEGESDFYSIRTFIHRISRNPRIGTKKFVGQGCGKIKRKCNAWAVQLKQKGCSALVIVHDLDNHGLNQLISEISQALDPNPFEHHLICIPIREIEAWFLSDPEGIRKALKLSKRPNVKGLPEQIQSPKEYLGRLVEIASNNEKIYNNVKHNEKIAGIISLERAKTCQSFVPFYDFVRAQVT